MREDPQTEWIDRLNVAWQLRADAGVRAAQSALARAGIVPQLLEVPSVERTAASARRPHAVLSVTRSDYSGAVAALRAAGWKSTVAGRIVSLMGPSMRLRAEALDLVLTTRDPGRGRVRPVDLAWLWGLLKEGARLSGPWRHFMVKGLDLIVLPGVFQPDQTADQVVNVVLERIESVQAPVIVDVGTGAGGFALGVAAARADAAVFGFDVSRAAMWNARMNARRLRLRNVQFSQGALLSGLPPALDRRVNVIVANLPWVAPVLRLQSDSVTSWRGPPWTVQGADADGLGLVRQLAREAASVLAPGGAIVFEVDQWQGPLLVGQLCEGDYDAVVRDSGIVLANLRGKSFNRSD